ncbi:spermidine synthase [Zavarzinia sp. CC-PAN008]|uniref:spermidine synthase n=1 Tax=Zavarzinia sp. CC-PAN008 TaxID=3243332 RepID=UPI003F748B8E
MTTRARRHEPATARHGARWRVAALAAGLLLGAAWAAGPAVAQEFVETRESAYNSIFIKRSGDYLSMVFGHNQKLFTESAVNTKDPLELPVAYNRLMTVALAYQPKTASVLEIGLGGGSTAWYLHQTFPDMTVTAVELDPVVIELAQKYFFVRPDERLKLVEQDGRLHLVRRPETYDLIMVDAYRGPFVPFHLLTKEFFAKAKERLNPGGVLAQNVEPSTMIYDSAIATIASVFEHVDVYPAQFNYVAIAYDGPQKTDAELAARAAAIDGARAPRYALAGMVTDRRPVEQVAGQVFTDDFAPVEMLNATERHNHPDLPQ